MQTFLDTAIEAAKAASVPILARYHGDFEVEIKSDQTPVTVADREAELVIREVLSGAFADHGIYGEEFGKDQPDA
ncbi:MAG: inositol monophosphatase family protein, partial [Pseudomonadota bacterium]